MLRPILIKFISYGSMNQLIRAGNICINIYRFFYIFILMYSNDNVNNNLQIKFVEKCYVFDDNIIRLRDKEMCAALTFQSVEKHLLDDHIHFSFLIKKNCKETLNIKVPVQSDKPNAIIAKPISHSVPNKGILKSNNVRKGQSIPDIKSPTTIIVKQEVPTTPPDTIQPSKQNNLPPDYSSINKGDDEKHFKSPAYCTSAINRNDNDLVSKFLCFIH